MRHLFYRLRANTVLRNATGVSDKVEMISDIRNLSFNWERKRKTYKKTNQKKEMIWGFKGDESILIGD